jgi:hypothetical protein
VSPALLIDFRFHHLSGRGPHHGGGASRLGGEMESPVEAFVPDSLAGGRGPPRNGRASLTAPPTAQGATSVRLEAAQALTIEVNVSPASRHLRLSNLPQFTGPIPELNVDFVLSWGGTRWRNQR